MKIEQVKKLDPYARFRYYINERLEIRMRRDAGLPQERWTTDAILSTYKFTNVKRSWDRTSRWLADNWYTPHGGHQHAGLAALTARFICYIPSLAAIGFPLGDVRRWVTDSKEILGERARRGAKVFTSAYMIAGGDSEGRSKVDWVFEDIIWRTWHLTAWLRMKSQSAMSLHESLKEMKGFGDFMTQEVVLDLMETWVLRHATDRMTYGLAGPGAMRGLKRVAGKGIETSLNRADAREQMVMLWETLRTDDALSVMLRETYPLTVHDVEFSLCEFDKYERALWGQGTPKQLFTPTEDGGLGL